MTAHLLLITLGPVQDFIAQARRTRDLWYGSHLLSELGRATARTLAENGAELVFPSLKKGDIELEPCPAPLRNGVPPLSVPNKILAVVPSGIDPENLAEAARDTTMRFWRDEIAEPVRGRIADLLAVNHDPVWREQIDTFIEFAASWAPVDNYSDARREVEESIGSRKFLRDFEPWTAQNRNVPKSSLDGARETVLSPPGARSERLRAQYRIGLGEQLDAVGLVKRAGGDPDQFVPIVNIALAYWLDLATRETPENLASIAEACRVQGVSGVRRGDLPCAAPFAFDASVFLPSRWSPLFEEQGLTGDPEAWGEEYVRPILREMDNPYPYVACLVADGDRMGRAIDMLGSADAHRSFSAALSLFAADARTIVEQNHRGALIYAGGDDVLGFLPLPGAISCAGELRGRFLEIVAEACGGLPAEARPTLSVGIGVGHVMEGMGDLLTLGREAERAAKIERDSLAILVDKRSGGRRSWTTRWGGGPVDRLDADIRLLSERLSTRKVHEVSRTLRRLPGPANAQYDGWTPLLLSEVSRSLSRAEGGTISLADAGLAVESGADYASAHEHVRLWVDRVLIARMFATAIPRKRHERIAA